jgi:carbamoyltransferase
MARWIAGINPGHNGSLCLLRDGEIVFFIEEERLSRQKYDGTPFRSMMKILDYTDRLDYLVIGGTSLQEMNKLDWTNENLYAGMARKMGLISDPFTQVAYTAHWHHKMHAACAFYRSGFDRATAVIIDGAGSVVFKTNKDKTETAYWEVETMLDCSYPDTFNTLYKHRASNDPHLTVFHENFQSNEDEESYQLFHATGTSIVKAYEAATVYCGFAEIEAGKTMGLFPYGKPNSNIPPLFKTYGESHKVIANRDLFVPCFPRGALVNTECVPELQTDPEYQGDVTLLQNRRDMAYAVQTQTQERVLDLIVKAVELSGCKNVVFSGGYGLNCVANYYYLTRLNELGINFYVEPISSDAGTAIGAAISLDRHMTQNMEPMARATSLYLGIEHTYSAQDIEKTVAKYQAVQSTANNQHVVDLLRNKNIVAVFQGCAEAGPRALGNRSILFDPTAEDGKDHVNRVKRREYFRPFAGSILQEHAHEWFDMRGMTESPHMMYAMNCQPGKGELIPSIIHVDGTCRIQTVTREQNPLYYDLISDFHKASGVPILFNTSFNLGGEPLVETLDDAVRTLINSEIEYLYLPEYQVLITVKNQGE